MSEREPIHEPTLPIFADEADWVHHAAERFEHSSATEILEWGLDRFHPRLAISAAGGVDGMAIIDMAWRINPEVRVFTLDTGRLPPETYQLFEKVRERYGIDVEFEFPERTAVERIVNADGPNLMYKSVDLRVACCEIRKVEPLKRKLSTLDAWVAGLRREQWRTRRNVAKVELDRDHGGIVKLNPLADWTADEVWGYVRRNDVPYHELFDQGYASIGCAPCTRPVQPGESERAGRWWWESETDKECGIHCSVGLLGTKSDRERTAAGTGREAAAGTGGGAADGEAAAGTGGGAGGEAAAGTVSGQAAS
jgi:thioredoxin-dependent adenylylsulfate APS reductase